MLILAASTQRTIGLVIALVVALAFAIYVLVNVFSTGKAEIGSEIELAPNRKPYYDDETLETKKLDLSLAAGAGTLAIIALALPLYWLGEPGRQDGYVELTSRQFADRGGEQYEELCAQCHGANGVGGSAAFTVLDEQGRFITSVSWTAPALDTVLYRFSEEEVLHVLNYGRPQSPMPAWGAPGGGPLTTQQVDELIDYLQRIQLPPEDVQAEVNAGLRSAVFEDARAADPEPFEVLETLSADADTDLDELEAAQAVADAAIDAYLAELATDDVVAYGELLFNNSAGAGAYGCARCHTAGSSWDANGALAANPSLEGLVKPEIPGGGGFGPSLTDERAQFDSVAGQAAFIDSGCEPNLQYGNNGVCEPSGQMPGFGGNASELSGEAGRGLLEPDQITAVVEYERSLG
ncbi:MAG: cytochrome c [Acidimicrobiales bacterium]